MRLLLSLIIGGMLCSCSAIYPITTNIKTIPTHPFPNETKLMVLGSNVDVTAESYRKNKELQFVALIDTALYWIGESLNHNNILSFTERDERKFIGCDNECQQRFITLNSADYLILINSFKIRFEQTEVQVTETESGKSREAFYDIIAEVDYLVRSKDGVTDRYPVEARQFHSSRTVLSGLLAAGPNIVSNQDDALKILSHNVRLFMRNFFPDSDSRIRPLFAGKIFKPMKAFMQMGDTQKALEFCEQQSHQPDRTVAAQSFYNMAVLQEYSGNYLQARDYLMESMNIIPLQEARNMLMDYPSGN